MIYQCDVFLQGAHLPLAMCEPCKERLEQEGVAMKCIVVSDSKTKCSQCRQSHLHAYDKRRRVTNL